MTLFGGSYGRGQDSYNTISDVIGSLTDSSAREPLVAVPTSLCSPTSVKIPLVVATSFSEATAVHPNISVT